MSNKNVDTTEEKLSIYFIGTAYLSRGEFVSNYTEKEEASGCTYSLARNVIACWPLGSLSSQRQLVEALPDTDHFYLKVF